MPPLAPLRQRKLPLPAPAEAPLRGSTREECSQLYQYLLHTGYVGLAQGITRQTLRRQFAAHVGRHIGDRKLQRIVSDAPNYRTGYFVVQSAEDFDTCIGELESRIREHRWRVDSLRALRPPIQGPGIAVAED
jgi:hypothetical protein